MTTSPAPLDCLCAGIVVADFVSAPVAQVPPAGGVMMTDSIALAIGGCASNVATNLARLGRRAVVVGRVGADMPGKFVRDQLTSNGVDTTHLLETTGVQTSSTLVINVQNEDRRFIHAFGANGRFDGSEISPTLVRQAKVLYLGGYCLMPRLATDQVAELFRMAREAHVPTVLDVVLPDLRDYRECVENVLPWTDVFLPNIDEARQLTGLADPLEQARHFRGVGAETVVITCGREGAVLVSPAGSFRAGTYSVDFVDGTGSGDAFAAGYISGLIDGYCPERCLEIGSALGASCVRQTGATTGVFTNEELDEFLKQRRLPIERL